MRLNEYPAYGKDYDDFYCKKAILQAINLALISGQDNLNPKEFGHPEVLTPEILERNVQILMEETRQRVQGAKKRSDCSRTSLHQIFMILEQRRIPIVSFLSRIVRRQLIVRGILPAHEEWDYIERRDPEFRGTYYHLRGISKWVEEQKRRSFDVT